MHAHRIAFGCLLLCLAHAVAADDDKPDNVTDKTDASALVVPQFNDDGTKDWVLRAGEVVGSGRTMLLRRIAITLFRPDDEGGTIRVRTTGCSFSRRTRTAHGDKAVTIRSNAFIVTGVGFDFDGRRRVMTIRRRVQMKILPAGRKMLAKPRK